MADAIFISYRRDDAEGEAGRLFDDLVRAFGNDAVFMDVAGIKPGVDFRKAIEDNVASCGVLLAIVGPSWASITGADGKRRLEDPNDFVTLEIGSALRREVPVIPVLVHDAKMPAAHLLPESLKSFSYRNSVELSHARWNSDVALLEEALKSYVKPLSASPIHATVPVQLPAPHHPAGLQIETAAKQSGLPLKAGMAAAAVLAIAVAAYFATRKPVPIPAPAPGASTAQYVGTWKRPGNGGSDDALGTLVISSSSGGGLALHAYGKCQAQNCDWGQQPGVVSGLSVSATFAPSPSGSDSARSAVVIVHPAAGGLDVLVQNSFQGPAGARTSSAHLVFQNAK